MPGQQFQYGKAGSVTAYDRVKAPFENERILPLPLGLVKYEARQIYTLKYWLAHIDVPPGVILLPL